MVFTQGRGFVLGASFGLQIRSLRCRVLVCHAADTASFATWFLFGKLFCVATLFAFGEKRCRKNLPLCDLPGIYGTTPLAKRTQRICDANIDWLFGAVLLGRLARLDIRIHAADVRPILGVRILRMVLRRLFGVGGDRTTWREQRAPSAMPNMFRTVGDPACPAMSDLRRRLARGY